MVDNGQGVDAGQDEILGDLAGQRLHGDEEDIGIADLLLGLDAPETNLTIVQGDFIWVC